MNTFLIFLFLYIVSVIGNYFMIKWNIKICGEIEKEELIKLSIIMIFPIANILLFIGMIGANIQDWLKGKDKNHSTFIKHLYGLKEENRNEKVIYTYRNKVKEE